MTYVDEYLAKDYEERELKFSREYHFHKFHVYCNALFENDAVVEDIYRHSGLLHIEHDHHVHIFLWNTNADYKYIKNMAQFIENASAIINRPVYIHLPKVAKKSLGKVRNILSLFKVLDGADYRFILEDFVHSAAFCWGDYAPMPGKLYGYGYFPKTVMFIEWNRLIEAAYPVFISALRPEANTTFIQRREIFKLEGLMG